MKGHDITLKPFLDFLNTPNGRISFGLLGSLDRTPRGIAFGPAIITCPDGQSHEADYIKAW